LPCKYNQQTLGIYLVSFTCAKKSTSLVYIHISPIFYSLHMTVSRSLRSLANKNYFSLLGYYYYHLYYYYCLLLLTSFITMACVYFTNLNLLIYIALFCETIHIFFQVTLVTQIPYFCLEN